MTDEKLARANALLLKIESSEWRVIQLKAAISEEKEVTITIRYKGTSSFWGWAPVEVSQLLLIQEEQRLSELKQEYEAL